MSAGNPERFPWGRNEPTRFQRTSVALFVASLAAMALYFGRLHDPSINTDFHLAWFGARTLLSGVDPYPLVGPGLTFDWPYPLILPGTALVAAAPFTLLPVRAAATLFVFISSAVLVYGMTHDGWHRLPILASAAFFDSVFAAQWSILMTAALFIPVLGFIVSAKPQTGIPVVVSAQSGRTWWPAVAGTSILLAISLALLPAWPSEWAALARGVTHMKPLILAPFGFLVLVLVARWRRWESWLLISSALLPQTLMWYGALMPMAIAKTYRESCVLSMTSTLGFFVSSAVATAELTRAGMIVWGVFALTVYLPAVWVVMQRPNEGEIPYLLRMVSFRRAVISS